MSTNANGEVQVSLAAAIKDEITAAKAAASSAVEHAQRAGELLIQAKQACRHGEWGAWLRNNVDLSERTARAYTQLAKRWQKLSEPERQRVADLPLRHALTEGARRDPLPDITPEKVDSELRRMSARLQGLKAWAEVLEREENIDGLVEFVKEAGELQNQSAELNLRIERELGRLTTSLKADLSGRFPDLSETNVHRLMNELVTGRLVVGSGERDACPNSGAL